MKNDRIALLESAPIPKAVMKMALPSIIGLLVMAIYNIVDTMFVAWLGTDATGATQIVFPMVMIVGAIGLTIGIGGSSYISRLLGEGEKKRAENTLTLSVLLSATFGVILTIVSLMFLEPLLKMFGATPNMMALSKGYATFILIGALPQILNMTLNNLLRSEGSAKNSMIAMLIGAILNIILDPIFIFAFDWGIEGAAIATSLSQLVTTVILFAQYFTKKTVLHLSFKSPKWDGFAVTEVFKMGAPTFARQVLVSVSMTIMNVLAAKYGGDFGIAAMGIVMRMTMLTTYILFGLSQGFQPVVGYNYGAGQKERVKEALHFTLRTSLIIAIVSGAISLWFDDAILGIFKPEAEVLVQAKMVLKYYVFSIVFMSVTNVISVYYQGIGKSMPALILSVARQGAFLIPLAYLLPHIFGIQGVYMSQVVADVFTFGLMFVLFFKNPLQNQAKQSVINEG